MAIYVRHFVSLTKYPENTTSQGLVYQLGILIIHRCLYKITGGYFIPYLKLAITRVLMTAPLTPFVHVYVFPNTKTHAPSIGNASRLRAPGGDITGGCGNPHLVGNIWLVSSYCSWKNSCTTWDVNKKPYK